MWVITPIAQAVSGLTFELEEIASGLGKAVKVTHAGDDRLFVVDRSGYIRIVRSNGSVEPTPFLDISTKVSTSVGEGGFLGLAFHPDYQSNGLFYVHYTMGPGSDLKSVISRYTTNGSNPDRANAGSESRLMVLEQPAGNHNGGDLAFSPIDGYLYITLGDGGGAGDTYRNGQDTTTPLGAILRIDVDSSSGNQPSDCRGTGSGNYRVPSNNPLRDGSGGSCDEIWAYGLRNPFRFSFDRGTGDIYMGDVGQSSREEVNYRAASEPAGANFGWRCYEGNTSYSLTGCASPNQYTDPIFDYNRTSSQRSVIGGYTYRGLLSDNLKGVYLSTDYFSTKIWAAKANAQGNWNVSTYNVLPRTGFAGWGEDVDGELYVVNQSSGQLYWVKETSGASSPNEAPVIEQGATLSRTMDEDGSPAAFSANISATDDSPVSQLSWQVTTQPGNGTAAATGTGASPTVEYVPANNYSGSDTFVVEVADNEGLTDTIRVNVTVRPRNDAPRNPTPPSVSGTPEVGETLTASPGQWNDNNDSPPGTISFAYQWQRANNASGGGLSTIPGATGSTYTVVTADGTKFLRVRVIGSDNGTGSPASASRTAYSGFVEIAGDDPEAPIIAQGNSTSVAMDEDAAPEAFALTLNASDDGPANQLSWSLSSSASHGTASATGTGNSVNVSYVPESDYSGSDSFRVRVQDGENESDVITVNVTVRPRNDAPVNTVAPNVSGNTEVGSTLTGTRGEWNDDRDNNPGELIYSYQWQRANASNGSGRTNIPGATSLGYVTKSADDEKFVRLRVIARDNGEGLPSTTQTGATSGWLKVTAEPNEAPVIDQGSATTVAMDEDSAPTAFSLALSATDDGAANELVWSLSGAPSNGTASVSGGGASPSLSYTPAADYNGSDSFVVQVADASGSTDRITVNVNVRPRNDRPNNTRAPTINGAPETLARLTLDRGDWNDSRDRTPGNLSYTYRWQVANSASGNGLANIPGEAGLTFDVPADFGGRYVRVHVTVRDDGEGLPAVQSKVEDTAFVLITTPSTSTAAPQIDQGANASVLMDEDSAPREFSLTLSATDDGAMADLTWSVAAAPRNGTASISGSGRSISVDYDPVEDFNGADQFDVQVADALGNVDSIQVNVEIRPRNDAPVVTRPPRIIGIPEVGAWLTADPGSWADDRDGPSGEITFEYKWQVTANARNTLFKDVPGEQAETFRVRNADSGKLVRLKVIATSLDGGSPRRKNQVEYSAPVPVDEGSIAADTLFFGGFE